MSENTKHVTLTAEEMCQLTKVIHGSDSAAAQEAREKMILANRGLVRFLAYKLCLHFNLNESMEEDVISEGTIGLMKAVDKFDGISAKFSTYAAHWIKAAMMEYVFNQWHSIRVPRRTMENIIKVKEQEKVLEKKLERVPSSEEIARKIGLSTTVVAKLRDSDMHYVSPIPDDDQEATDEFLVVSEYKEEQISEAMAALAELTPLEREVIELSVLKGKKLSDIAKARGCSTANLSQIRARAFAKIKAKIGG